MGTTHTGIRRYVFRVGWGQTSAHTECWQECIRRSSSSSLLRSQNQRKEQFWCFVLLQQGVRRKICTRKDEQSSLRELPCLQGTAGSLGHRTKKVEQDVYVEARWIFRIAECFPLFELFITHFSRTSTVTTIMNKANQLYKFVNLPILYFDTNPRYPDEPEKNNQLRSNMVLASSFLRRSRANNKAIGKRLKLVQKKTTFEKLQARKLTRNS